MCIRDRSNMLQKWRKPWLFRAILIGGIAISFIIFAIVYACIQLFEISHIAALNLLFVKTECRLFRWYAKFCAYEHVIRVNVWIGSHKVVKLNTVLFSN